MDCLPGGRLPSFPSLISLNGGDSCSWINLCACFILSSVSVKVLEPLGFVVCGQAGVGEQLSWLDQKEPATVDMPTEAGWCSSWLSFPVGEVLSSITSVPCSVVNYDFFRIRREQRPATLFSA